MRRKVKLIFTMMTHNTSLVTIGRLHSHNIFMIVPVKVCLCFASHCGPQKSSRIMFIIFMLVFALFYCSLHSCWHFHFYLPFCSRFDARLARHLRTMNYGAVHLPTSRELFYSFFIYPNYYVCRIWRSYFQVFMFAIKIMFS